jgi:hypothetical protein
VHMFGWLLWELTTLQTYNKQTSKSNHSNAETLYPLSLIPSLEPLQRLIETCWNATRHNCPSFTRIVKRLLEATMEHTSSSSSPPSSLLSSIQDPVETCTVATNASSGPTSTKHTPAAVTTVTAKYSTTPPMHSQTKQGSKCCGCCCDYRRVVIILNFVLVMLADRIIPVIIGSSGAGSPVIFGHQEADYLDDDGLMDIVEDVYRQQAILIGVGVFASIVAIVGACRYNIYMVGFNILYMIGSFIATIVLTNKAFNTLEEDYTGDEDIPSPVGVFVIQGVIICFFIYPHYGFMSEVKAGILSAETYPREKYCCC